MWDCFYWDFFYLPLLEIGYVCFCSKWFRKVSFLTELASSLYLTGLRRLPHSTANLFTFLNGPVPLSQSRGVLTKQNRNFRKKNLLKKKPNILYYRWNQNRFLSKDLGVPSVRVAKTCRPCGPVSAIFSGRCKFFGKSTRKTGENTRKQAKNRRFFGGKIGRC